MIDVIEIDAASYTGVDNIREIIDHAKFTPTQGKYKVYIIDEVHMLSKWAFNALLKTLEEPPAHVIFLLATTEIHKVPDTILSRVIRFDLRKIGIEDMFHVLEEICKKEGIKAEQWGLMLIVHRARGSMRDAITMLEKCILENTVTQENVAKALHLVSMEFLEKTYVACISWERKEIEEILSTLRKEGVDIRQFAAQMTEWTVNHIWDALDKNNFKNYKFVFDLFSEVFMQSRHVSSPHDVLSMMLYSCIREWESEKTIPTSTKEIEKQEIPSNDQEQAFSQENFLQKLQEHWIKSTLIPLLKTAHIEKNGHTISITTTIFCKNRCEETETNKILTEVGKTFFAEKIEIISSEPQQKEEDPIEMAQSIFNS